MSWLNNITLQKRIGLLVLSGLVIGLSLFSWLGIQSVNESVQRTLGERLIIARVIASQLDEHMGHGLGHLQHAADFNGKLPTKEQFETRAGSLSKILAESGIFTQNIILIDRDGKALQVEPEDSRINGSDIMDQPILKRTLQTGLPTISNLVSSPLIEMPTVIISTPIWDDKDEVIGSLAVLIDVEQSTISPSSQSVVLGKTGYTEIVDGNGFILARTKPALPPSLLERSDHPGKFVNLINQGQAIVGTCHRCHEVGHTLKRRRDVLAFAPLSTVSWGVAIRQSEEEALAPALQLKERLLLLGLVVVITTGILVWVTVQGIVKPISLLTAAVKRVAAGDFEAAMPGKRQDEIGQLSSAFYSMTQDLVKSRQELTKSRDELMVRNEELSALNSIAVTVNQSLNLKDVLGDTVRKVLEVTRTTTSCVFLRGADGNKLEMTVDIGLSNIFECQQSASSAASCACHQVLRNGQTLMVNDISQCPRLTEDVMVKQDISSFVSVPLKSKDRTLGIMNIACSSERYFIENDFRILDSIAYHMGLAIDNSALYEEVEQKKELRGLLLSSVISAQEEERKRIARELHDEYGQSLTILKMNLESLQNMAEPEQPQLKIKLKSAEALVANALEDLRRLTLDLRPYALDQLGLVAALRAYTQVHLETIGIRVEFKTKGMEKRLTPEVETVLFRIVQEAINNINKYAEARNVKIQLEVKADKTTAMVEDDGKGFDVESVFKPKIVAQSLGLLGIQERAALLGGTFTVKSRVGQGTCLTVEIPLVISLEESRLLKQVEIEPDGLET